LQGNNQINFLLNSILQADLDGLPDITLTMTCKGNKGDLTNVMLHPCVQANDASSMKNLQGQKICFSPPLDQFALCKYGIANVTEVPLRGFYQMKVKVCRELFFDET
jgi:hypothetical protein